MMLHASGLAAVSGAVRRSLPQILWPLNLVPLCCFPLLPSSRGFSRTCLVAKRRELSTRSCYEMAIFRQPHQRRFFSNPAPAAPPAKVLQRIRMLRLALAEANERYYVASAPTLSDSEYDSLFQELKGLEARYQGQDPCIDDVMSPTRTVGSSLGSRSDRAMNTSANDGVEKQKQRHAIPMLSINSLFSIDQLHAFFASTVKHAHKSLFTQQGHTYSVELKFDGMAVSLQFENFAFTRALTRGDGATGEDVTLALRRLVTPEHLPPPEVIAAGLRGVFQSRAGADAEKKGGERTADREEPAWLRAGCFEVRAELIVTKEAFDEINHRMVKGSIASTRPSTSLVSVAASASSTFVPFSTPRNMVSGLLHRKEAAPRIDAGEALSAVEAAAKGRLSLCCYSLHFPVDVRIEQVLEEERASRAVRDCQVGIDEEAFAAPPPLMEEKKVEAARRRKKLAVRTQEDVLDAASLSRVIASFGQAFEGAGASEPGAFGGDDNPFLYQSGRLFLLSRMGFNVDSHGTVVCWTGPTAVGRNAAAASHKGEGGGERRQQARTKEEAAGRIRATSCETVASEAAKEKKEAEALCASASASLTGQTLELFSAFVKDNFAKRNLFALDIDGIVVKVDDLRLQLLLGRTGRAPRYMAAYKFPAKTATTRLLNISYQVGRSGRVTPVAEVEPVLLHGAVIARAALHNHDYLRTMGLAIGDMVYVERKGDVIPVVSGRVQGDGDGDSARASKRPPNACVDGGPVTEETIYCPCPVKSVLQRRLTSSSPSCAPVLAASASADITAKGLFCESLDCPEQRVFKIVHFASKKCMNIAGLGPETVRHLVELGVLRRVEDVLRIATDAAIQQKLFDLVDGPSRDGGEVAEGNGVRSSVSVVRAKGWGTKKVEKLIKAAHSAFLPSPSALSSSSLPPSSAPVSASVNAYVDEERLLQGLGLRGLGASTARTLLTRFGSIETVLSLGEGDLQAVPGISGSTALALATELRICRESTFKSLKENGLRLRPQHYAM